MKYQPNTSNFHYDYANKCDCSEDDKCGCDYPNNMPHNFTNDYLKKIPPHPKTAILGKQAPNFIAPAILGDNTIIQHFNLSILICILCKFSRRIIVNKLY